MFIEFWETLLMKKEINPKSDLKMLKIVHMSLKKDILEKNGLESLMRFTQCTYTFLSYNFGFLDPEILKFEWIK